MSKRPTTTGSRRPKPVSKTPRKNSSFCRSSTPTNEGSSVPPLDCSSVSAANVSLISTTQAVSVSSGEDKKVRSVVIENTSGLKCSRERVLAEMYAVLNLAEATEIEETAEKLRREQDAKLDAVKKAVDEEKRAVEALNEACHILTLLLRLDEMDKKLSSLSQRSNVDTAILNSFKDQKIPMILKDVSMSFTKLNVNLKKGLLKAEDMEKLREAKKFLSRFSTFLALEEEVKGVATECANRQEEHAFLARYLESLISSVQIARSQSHRTELY